MDVIARSRFIRRGPRKARLVADTVRGMRVEEALTALQFAPQHAATDLVKTIKSAAANAEHNFELDREELWLKTIMVDDGPTMKRIRPVSRGMAHQYFHRTCHITVVVEDRPEETPRRRRARRQQEPEASVDETALAGEAAAVTEPEASVDEAVAAAEAPAAEAEPEAPAAEATTEPGAEESASESQVNAEPADDAASEGPSGEAREEPTRHDVKSEEKEE